MHICTCTAHAYIGIYWQISHRAPELLSKSDENNEWKFNFVCFVNLVQMTFKWQNNLHSFVKTLHACFDICNKFDNWYFHFEHCKQWASSGSPCHNFHRIFHSNKKCIQYYGHGHITNLDVRWTVFMCNYSNLILSLITRSLCILTHFVRSFGWINPNSIQFNSIHIKSILRPNINLYNEINFCLFLQRIQSAQFTINYNVILH